MPAALTQCINRAAQLIEADDVLGVAEELRVAAVVEDDPARIQSALGEQVGQGQERGHA